MRGSAPPSSANSSVTDESAAKRAQPPCRSAARSTSATAAAGQPANGPRPPIMRPRPSRAPGLQDAQRLGHAPRLRRAAARRVRRIAVEDLRQLAEPVAGEVRAQPVEERRLDAPAHALASVGVDSEEERPHRALVIGGVARALIAGDAAAIAVAA